MIQLFDFIQDPAHGWVKVPKKMLLDLGIAEKISHYSYVRNEYAYLEEDGDLSTFLQACEERGITLEFRDRICKNRYSKVRSYPSYNAYHLISRGE